MPGIENTILSPEKKIQKLYYAKHISDCKHNMKKTLYTIKQVTGTTKSITKKNEH